MSNIHFLHVVDQWLNSIGRPAAGCGDEGVLMLEFPSGGAFAVELRPDGLIEMSAGLGAFDSYAIREIARRDEAEEDSSPSRLGDPLTVLAWNDEGELWQVEARPADARMFLVWEGPQPESLSDWTQAVEGFAAACEQWRAG